MGVAINPKRITGDWDEGFCLDVHTTHSEFVGHNAYGHPEYSTTRSPLGDLVFRLKYRADKSALAPAAETVADFLKTWNPGIDAIVPVPPSNPYRKGQPVIEIAKLVCAHTGVPLCDACITKVKKTAELKNIYGYQERMNLLADSFQTDPGKTAGKGLLLFDDLYRSGATMNTIACLLKAKGAARAVYVLAMTWTRSKL